MRTGAIALLAAMALSGSALAHGGGGGGGMGGGMGGMGGSMGGGFGGSMHGGFGGGALPGPSATHMPSGVPAGQPSTLPQSAPARSGDSIGSTVSSSAKANAETDNSRASTSMDADSKGDAHAATQTDADMDTTHGKHTASTSMTTTAHAMPVSHKAELHAANDLKRLNAVHASAMARSHASAKSTVGMIATYDKQMQAALAISDQAQQTAAITAARQNLASNAKVTLTAPVVSKIDSDLGISGASPSLGTSTP